MVVKFNKPFEDYKYILSFDLAKLKTGYSLYDIRCKEIMETGIIDMHNIEVDEFWLQYASKIRTIIQTIGHKYGSKDIFIIKEKLPMQAGMHSTIATLQELAKVHGIFDFITQEQDMDVYDWEGVHSVSVKSYFKKLTEIDKPQKEDIAHKIYEIFPTYRFIEDNYDITDSIAVVLTLINNKWNKDIEEEIKVTKKEIKKFKSEKKLTELASRIEYLSQLRR